MTQPKNAVDLSGFTEMVAGSSEFLRAWIKSDGPTVSFIDPRPVGADPAQFGIALADIVEAGAKTYARAVKMPEAEALARIWAGLDAQRQHLSEAAARSATPKPTGPIPDFLSYTQPTERG